jgi:hypothetical protein
VHVYVCGSEKTLAELLRKLLLLAKPGPALGYRESTSTGHCRSMLWVFGVRSTKSGLCDNVYCP